MGLKSGLVQSQQRVCLHILDSAKLVWQLAAAKLELWGADSLSIILSSVLNYRQIRRLWKMSGHRQINEKLTVLGWLLLWTRNFSFSVDWYQKQKLTTVHEHQHNKAMQLLWIHTDRVISPQMAALGISSTVAI